MVHTCAWRSPVPMGFGREYQPCNATGKWCVTTPTAEHRNFRVTACAYLCDEHLRLYKLLGYTSPAHAA